MDFLVARLATIATPKYRCSGQGRPGHANSLQWLSFRRTTWLPRSFRAANRAPKSGAGLEPSTAKRMPVYFMCEAASPLGVVVVVLPWIQSWPTGMPNPLIRAFRRTVKSVPKSGGVRKTSISPWFFVYSGLAPAFRCLQLCPPFLAGYAPSAAQRVRKAQPRGRLWAPIFDRLNPPRGNTGPTCPCQKWVRRPFRVPAAGGVWWVCVV